MSRSLILSIVFIIALMFMVSCSGGDGNMVAPTPTDRDTVATPTPGTTACFGLWQVTIDPVTGTGDIVQLRNAAKILNVLGFMEPPALTSMDLDWGDMVIADPLIDVGVILSHPFPGLDEFSGFDVRGVCFGPKITNADGLTVIPSPEYFAGVPFGYQDGMLGAPDSYGNYDGLAGYKYFCEGIGEDEVLSDFFSVPANLADRGLFTSNTSVQRNYNMDWSGTGYGFLVFNYAIYANFDWPTGSAPWDVDDWDITSANSAEAFCISTTELANTLYYAGTSGGGAISLQLEIWDWQGDISNVTIESVEPGIVTQVGYDVDLGVFPGGHSYGYEFYAVAASPTEVGDLDLLITVTDEQTFGDCWFMDLLPTSNGLYGDKIYNCFIHTTTVVANGPVIITSGVDGEDLPLEESEEEYTVTAWDPVDPITYSWTVTDSDDVVVPGFDGVPGDGAGALDIDWGDFPYAWALAGSEFDIDCDVSSGGDPSIPADTLTVTVSVDGDLWVSNHPDFASVPDNGTQTEPYSTPAQAISALPSNPGATIVIDSGNYNLTTYMYMTSTYHNNVTVRGYAWYTSPATRPTLLIRHSSSYGVAYIRASGVTFQGLKIVWSTSYSGYRGFYISSATNPTIRDCSFTGRCNSSNWQAVDEWQSPGFTFTHNKVYDAGPSNAYSSSYVYAVRCTNSINPNTRTITYNEFTNIYPSNVSYRYTRLQVIGLRTPGGITNITNNLIHHINVRYYSGYTGQESYAFYNNTGNTGTYNFSNNTVDRLTFMGSNIGYTNYCYYNYYYRATPVAKNNIVSTYTGASFMRMYGYYHYYNGANGVTYCDAYNVEYPWTGFFIMTGNITADPRYVNNTTPPYNYNLSSGSPCAGTGQGGDDMGCYGNMGTGETIIGLITPE